MIHTSLRNKRVRTADRSCAQAAAKTAHPPIFTIYIYVGNQVLGPSGTCDLHGGSARLFGGLFAPRGFQEAQKTSPRRLLFRIVFSMAFFERFGLHFASQIGFKIHQLRLKIDTWIHSILELKF